MSLLFLLLKEIKKSYFFFLMATLGMALSAAALVEVLNVAAENIVNKSIQQIYFLYFLVFVLLFYFTREYIFKQAILQIELSVNQMRQRIGNKIRHISLSNFEKLDKNFLYARLTQDMIYISTVSFHLIGMVQSVFTILAMLIYIAFLSSWTFVCMVFAVGSCIVIYKSILEEINDNFAQLSKVESNLFEKLNHLIRGFKELKLNQLKSELVFDTFRKVIRKKRSLKIKINQLYNRAFTYSQFAVYGMIAFIIFIIPKYYTGQAIALIKITAAILFIIGPLEVIFRVLPRIAYANNGAKNILELENGLDQYLNKQKRKYDFKEASYGTIPFQKNIVLQSLVYQYESNEAGNAFSIGPMSLTFKKGEVIFITGGNGSGKSTFLKMLTGLYLPKNGKIFIDSDLERGIPGTLVDLTNYDQYSNLFTTIFTDFHLFDQLYGLSDIDEAKVQLLLREMGLNEEKTTYENGRFSNIKLSSGQKKRLALINASLEDKDIYIFDEVASDLDPEFRDTYYYNILADLKALNKTVFVVSHDKSYWEVADRVLELKNGQFKEKKLIDYTKYITK